MKGSPKLILQVPVFLLLLFSVYGFFDEPHAFIFPSLLLLFLFLLSLKGTSDWAPFKNKLRAIHYLPIAVIIVYAMSISYVGIWIATIVFVVVLQWMLERKLQWSKQFITITSAILIIIIFQQVLDISFPSGRIWS